MISSDAQASAPGIHWRSPALWVVLPLIAAQATTGIVMAAMPFGIARLGWIEVHLWIARALVPALAFFVARHFAVVGDRRATIYTISYWFALFPMRVAGGNSLFALVPVSALVFWRTLRRFQPRLSQLTRAEAVTARVLFVVMQICIATGMGTHFMEFFLGRRLFPGEGIFTLNYYALHQWAGLLLPVALGAHLGVHALVRFAERVPRGLGRRAPWAVVALLVASAYAMVGWNWRFLEYARVAPERFVPVEWSPHQEASFCASCHRAEYEQWAVSSHRHAATNALYVAALATTVERHGSERAAFCEACHNPLALAEGYDEEASGADPPSYTDEGVTCIACHRVVEIADPPANGELRLGMLPVDAPPEASPEETRELMRRSIFADTRGHRRDVDVASDWRGCASCHRLEHPDTAGADEPVRLQDAVSTWETGPYRDTSTDCIMCHMPRLWILPSELSEPDLSHPHAHHTSFGLNQALALYATSGDPQALADRDRIANELLEEFPGLPALEAAIGIAHGSLEHLRDVNRHRQQRPFALQLALEPGGAGDGAQELVVTTVNARAGHALPIGTLDMNELWLSVELEVDGDRRTLVGGLDADGDVDTTAPTLGARWLDADGRPVDHHDLLAIRAVRDVRQIGPGEARTDRVALELPEPPPTGATLHVAWNYRRVSPASAEELLGERSAFPVSQIGVARLPLDEGARR